MDQLQTSRASQKRENHFVTVLSLAFILGMAIAGVVFLLWRHNPAALQPFGPMFFAAVAVCPAFILSIAVGSGLDSPLIFVLVLGTILFANGFMYSGVAAGLYAVVTTLQKRRAGK